MAATASADGPLVGAIGSFARAHPKAPAIVTDDAVVSYGQLIALVSNVAQALHRAGLRPGELTGVTFQSPAVTLVVLVALARIGAISVNTRSRMPPPERDAIYRRFGVAREVCDGTTPPVAGCGRLVVNALEARGDEWELDALPFAPDRDTPLRLALTSGTTGEAKAVMQTHGSFVERMRQMQCGDMREARVLPPPLHVTAALNMAMLALCEGGTVFLVRDDTPAAFLGALARHRITHLGLPPANLALLLRELREDRVAFPEVRHLRLMGGTPSAALADLARRRFSPRIYVPYGLGEIGVAAMATPDLVARDPASSGRVAPGATVQVLDASGAPCAPGESGEIRVAIEGMPEGYHGPDRADRSRFRDGWFYPGDRGRLSADGLVYIEGRADDVINAGGRKAAPAYLERVLESHPLVQQAAVFGWEEAGSVSVAAVIVPSGPVDWRALHAFALARLSTLAPARYFEARELPRGELAKLDRARVMASFTGAKPAFVT